MPVLVDDRSPVRDEDRMIAACLYFGAVLFGVDSGERFENRSEDPTPKSFLELVPWLWRRGRAFDFKVLFLFSCSFGVKVFSLRRRRKIRNRGLFLLFLSTSFRSSFMHCTRCSGFGANHSTQCHATTARRAMVASERTTVRRAMVYGRTTAPRAMVEPTSAEFLAQHGLPIAIRVAIGPGNGIPDPFLYCVDGKDPSAPAAGRLALVRTD